MQGTAVAPTLMRFLCSILTANGILNLLHAIPILTRGWFFFFFFILEESRFHSCIYAKGNENICPREICWIFITALFVTLPNGNNPHVHKPWMNTCKAYNMAYLYNGLLLGHEKERRTDTSHSMDECGNYATRKKTVDSINITSRRENPTETERKLVVA